MERSRTFCAANFVSHIVEIQRMMKTDRMDDGRVGPLRLAELPKHPWFADAD